MIDLSFAKVEYNLKKSDNTEKTYSIANLHQNKLVNSFKNKNYSKFSQKLKNISNLLEKNYTLKVGWFEGDKYNNGEKVGIVAYKQEHGFITTLPNGKQTEVPPRPFVRPAMANNSNKWRKQILEDIKTVLSENKSRNIKSCFDRLGKTVRDDIKEAITDVWEPPLSDYTIDLRMEKKGVKNFNRLGLKKTQELMKPLIDTGKMIDSCKYSVKKG